MAEQIAVIEMSVERAIEVAIAECKNLYALQYLNTIERARAEYGEHGVKVQVMYAVSNMNGWHGEIAREVKKVLRIYTA